MPVTRISRPRPATASVSTTFGDEDPRRLFGLRIKELRADLGITQEEAADRIGVFRTYMSRMESGAANPTLTMLHQISQALGIHVTALLEPPSGLTPRRVESARRVSRGRVRK